MRCALQAACFDCVAPMEIGGEQVRFLELFDRLRDGLTRRGSWEAIRAPTLSFERLLAAPTFRLDELPRRHHDDDDLDDDLHGEDDAR